MEITTIPEALPFTTIRIEAILKDNSSSFGTGFFFLFSDDKKNPTLPFIVTNKHVLKDAISIRLNFTCHATAEKAPLIGKIRKEEITDLSNKVYFHPDSNIDLALISISHIWLSNPSVYIMAFSSKDIPTKADIDKIFPLEKISLIGYPDALWDEKNNLPIFRSGVIATMPSIDYNGNKVFLIDASCYPGSSGSPVILYNHKSLTTDENNSLKIDSRLFLLGIQSATFVHQVTGNIIAVDIPTKTVPLIKTQIPNNLGIIIKSSCLLDFKKVIPQ